MPFQFGRGGGSGGGSGGTFTPTQQNLYNAVKAIFHPASNAGVSADDSNRELDVGGSGTTLIRAWSSGSDYDAHTLIRDSNRVYLVLADITNSTNHPSADVGHFEAVDGYEGAFLTGKAYAAGTIVLYQNHPYFVRSNVASTNTANPNASSAFLRIDRTVFNLHDDVGTEATALLGTDRLLIAQESESGDPNAYITGDNARTYLKGYAGEWPVGSNHAFSVGDLTSHDGRMYYVNTAHTVDVNNGPESNTNYTLLSNWTGTWAAGYYDAGSIVLHAGSIWLAAEDVANTDPAPDHATNTKWHSGTSVSIEANPSNTGTHTLTSIEIDGTVYEIPSGGDAIQLHIDTTAQTLAADSWRAITLSQAPSESSFIVVRFFRRNASDAVVQGGFGLAQFPAKQWLDLPTVDNTGSGTAASVLQAGENVLGFTIVDPVDNELADASPSEVFIGRGSNTQMRLFFEGFANACVEVNEYPLGGGGSGGSADVRYLPQEWNATDDYAINDQVGFGEKIYIANKAITGAASNDDPATATDDWNEVDYFGGLTTGSNLSGDGTPSNPLELRNPNRLNVIPSSDTDDAGKVNALNSDATAYELVTPFGQTEADARVNALVLAQALISNTDPFADDKIPASITRDTELTAAIANFLTQTQVDARVVAGVIAQARTGNSGRWAKSKLPSDVVYSAGLASSIAPFQTVAQINALIQTALANELEWEGDYSASAAYVIGDVVAHTAGGTATYLCIAAVSANDANAEPNVGTNWEDHWLRLGWEEGDPNSYDDVSLSGDVLTFERIGGSNPTTVDLASLATTIPTRVERITFQERASGNTNFEANPIDTNPVRVITGNGDPQLITGISSTDFTLAPGDYMIDIHGMLTASNRNAAISYEIRQSSNNAVLEGSTTPKFPNNNVQLTISAYAQLHLSAPTEINIWVRIIDNDVAWAANWYANFMRIGTGITEGEGATWAPTEYATATFDLTGAAANVGLVDSESNPIIAPASGYLIATFDVPGLGLRGDSQLVRADRLRLARSSSDLTAGLYTDANTHQIYFEAGAQTPNAASSGNTILLETIAEGGGTPTVRPSIARFDVSGEQNPVAGDISNAAYTYDLAISQAGHASSARIVGYEGTSDNRPANVDILHQVGDLQSETGTVNLPANTSLAAGANYSIELQVFAEGETANNDPSIYHDYVITARAAAAAQVHFGLVERSAADGTIDFSGDITTASMAAGSYNTGTITPGTTYNLYWLVPTSQSQPTTWTHGGVDVTTAIGVLPASDLTINSIDYKLYRTTSNFDDLGSGQTYILS